MRRRPLSILVGALTLSVGLLGAAPATADTAAPTAALHSAHTTAAAPGSAATTADPPHIPAADAMAHLEKFQDIADAHGGNRAHGTPGYRASADYVRSTLDAAGFDTTLQSFTYRGATGYNVIAEWPHGDPDQVVMAGAHLDSVTRGPGINDNGSGSAAVLEVALEVSSADLRPEKRLRFGWWGAEELGLVGSQHYAQNLGSGQRAKIDAYLNFDMVGQKDVRRWGVYSHDATISGLFKEYFADQSIPTFDIRWDGSSDHSSFSRYGITVGGIGNSDDPCYHSGCDDLSNVGAYAMGQSTNAIAHTVWALAGTDNAANDFSVSVSPSSGTLEAGESVTTTVSTATTRGDAQTVRFSAQGLPSGVSARFDPVSVTSGESSTLTLTADAGAPSSNTSVTVTGEGTETTNSAAYALTVNGTSSCDGLEHTVSGSLRGGGSDVQPGGSWFQSGAGAHRACLDGPDGADFDLYLQKWGGAGWSEVARATSSGPDEELSYDGTAGYYRYRVHAYSGSGDYTLGYTTP
ncbi:MULTISPECIES: M28 family peptidase [Streptomyces]|uniref:M28 family peptidase n=1 Tax=Streptomyces TaxID=1883 RepID=UPI0022490DB8|nr:M28 family peptidase [Streptomyces sp. JHD 1]MCX2971416.1 M28 family peptidase [Streptomyces sp. JHD 1]